MWILLLMFPASVFAVVVESDEECAALWLLNQLHSLSVGQEPAAMCTRTWEA